MSGDVSKNFKNVIRNFHESFEERKVNFEEILEKLNNFRESKKVTRSLYQEILVKFMIN